MTSNQSEPDGRKKRGFLSRFFSEFTEKKIAVEQKINIEKSILDILDNKDNEYTSFDNFEKELIHNTVKLHNTIIREIMIPRGDVVTININDTIEKVIETATASGHSRLPVIDANLDHIQGFLSVKDLLKFYYNKNTFKIKNILRKPVFFPETKRADDALQSFKNLNTHIAIAVDEYGGVSGIVTLEDVLEEIVGEIRDEYDKKDEKIKKIKNNQYLIDASLNLDDINEELHLSLHEDEDYNSIAGLIYDSIGRIPKINEKIEHKNYTLKVTEMDENRITRIELTVNKQEM